MNWSKLGIFAGGVLFGTAGVSILSSKDAKKVYTQCTAAVLRGKDSIMQTATNIRENCGDIYEDAMDINEERYAKEEAMELENAKAIVEMYNNAGNEEDAGSDVEIDSEAK